MSEFKKTLADQRREYASTPLNREHLVEDPIDQFHHWFEQTIKAEVDMPNAMYLATASNDGFPSIRTVLLKDCDERGFVFYTNYLSRKGQDLETNPRAALMFYWDLLQRQVVVRGTVEKVSREESREYFHSRPLDSQLGAWASIQSAVIPDRHFLDLHFNDMVREHEGKEVPLPEYWGGYRVLPDEVEFWQGHENRLHDRILYRREGELWHKDRLSP